jgi:uracil-DNA glycosylase family protein
MAQVRELAQLRRDAAGCRRCPLWKHGTQTVFGQGDPAAAIMLVGEQPGDAEDLAGEPFVGPAGGILARALEAAGLSAVPRYVTNAVKHFKWEPRGKRRIHKKPRVSEIAACHYWLEEEIAAVQPKVLVAMGATAARALLGPGVSVIKARGQWLPSSSGAAVMVTVHPASILRAPDAEARRAGMAAFVADLKRAARRVRGGS